jgi:hypothetical protein
MTTLYRFLLPDYVALIHLQFTVPAAADYWVESVIGELTLEPQLRDGGAVFFDEVDQYVAVVVEWMGLS